MSEYIDKIELLKTINENPAEAHNERCAQLLDAILQAPTADVVEVVRCRDCKYYIYDGGKYPYCEMMTNKEEGEYYQPFDDHYCSYGERRGNEQRKAD